MRRRLSYTPACLTERWLSGPFDYAALPLRSGQASWIIHIFWLSG